MHMSLSLSLCLFHVSLAVVHYVGETIPPPDNAINDGIYMHMLAYATAASHVCRTQSRLVYVCENMCVCVCVCVCEVALQWDHH